MFNAGLDTANALSIAVHFPMIKMVNWFDFMKVRFYKRLVNTSSAAAMSYSERMHAHAHAACGVLC